MSAVAANEKPKLTGPSRPLGSPEIPQFHLPGSGKGVWAPRLYGAAEIRFGERRRRIEETRRVAFMAPLDVAAKTIDWDAAQPTNVTPADLKKDPPVAASYQPLPAGAMELKSFTRWAKAFDRWLARTQRAEFTTKQDPPETLVIGPKRGGVSVEIVAIVWELI